VTAAIVLRDGNKAEFIRVRAALKKARGIKITEWDAQVRGTEPPAENEDKKVADLLVEMARGACEFFHDDDREPYAAFDVDGHREVWPVKSSGFLEWLSFAFHKQHD